MQYSLEFHTLEVKKKKKKNLQQMLMLELGFVSHEEGFLCVYFFGCFVFL